MISTTATPFDETPEGALRINPLEIKRILSTHPWLVPVKASRVPELDDPIRPLWPRREPPVAYHVLGGASLNPVNIRTKNSGTRLQYVLKVRMTWVPFWFSSHNTQHRCDETIFDPWNTT